MNIRDLRRIRPMLDLKIASIIATSIVHAKLDYCNSLFLNIDNTQINRLRSDPLFRMLSPVLSLKPQNTTTSLLFSKSSTGSKLNAKCVTHFNPLSPYISPWPVQDPTLSFNAGASILGVWESRPTQIFSKGSGGSWTGREILLYLIMYRKQGFFVTERADMACRQIKRTMLWNVWNFSVND